MMDKARGELIQDVRNMNQQLEHSREKLGRSRTERESNAAQRELEELRKLVRDREEEIGKLTADAEAARQQNEATAGRAQEAGGRPAARARATSARSWARSTRALQGKQAERDAAVKQLPPQLYRRYDMIRSKRGTGIAQTTDGTCKACHMALPPQLFHRLRREPIARAVPVLQSHHLLRRAGRGRKRLGAVGQRLNGRAAERPAERSCGPSARAR